MSWLSKWLGIDRNKKVRRAVDDALHALLRRFLEDVKPKYLAALTGAGVPEAIALIGWNRIMAELD